MGILYAAPAAGALVGSVTSGWLGSVRRQGRAVIIAVITWGVVIVAFGFVRVLWVALILVSLAGWADLISAVLRSTIVQSAVTEPYRSRISGVQMGVVEGGPRLGDLESRAVATAMSTQFSIVLGGCRLRHRSVGGGRTPAWLPPVQSTSRSTLTNMGGSTSGRPGIWDRPIGAWMRATVGVMAR